MTPPPEAQLVTPSTTPSPARCYQAMQARDERFDGCFFVGVSSTGIYCRPVCRVKLPKPENCSYFGHAAQAEKAGYRPCLRCRPELSPGSLNWSIQDASRILAQQAARLLDAPESWGAQAPSIEKLAARLGVSDRHLRRIFEAQLGVSPVQYLQTRRLLTAKQLLADTDLPITQVALISGFASVRRFNAAFTEHYRLNPTQLRRDGKTSLATKPAPTTVRLAYRPPYDVEAMLAFFRTRQLHGVESVEAVGGPLRLGRTLRLDSAGQSAGQAAGQSPPNSHVGWMQATFDPAQCEVLLQVSDALREVLPLVMLRVRTLLDLDADPGAINAVLHPAFPQGDGLRVPGTVDGFELAVRAVLGQQITVAAARTLAQRLVTRFGVALAIDPARPAALTHLFPTPAALATAGGDALGQLGIVKQRQAAIMALAQAVAEQRIQLHRGVNVQATVDTLKTLPGIGDWTAQYIALRALRWPDAFPAGDVALHKALNLVPGVPGSKQAAKEAEARSLAWKPWRSYAVLRAWAAGNTTK